MIERKDSDNFTRFQTRERCALEIAACVFYKGYKMQKSFKLDQAFMNVKDG